MLLFLVKRKQKNKGHPNLYEKVPVQIRDNKLHHWGRVAGWLRVHKRETEVPF